LIVLKGRPIKEEALDAVDEEEVVEATEIEKAVDEVEAEAEEALQDPREEAKKTTLVAGSQSLSLAASLRRSSSRSSRRSISTLCPSRSTKLSTGSLVARSRTKS
jgi:hypothetical protein